MEIGGGGGVFEIRVSGNLTAKEFVSPFIPVGARSDVAFIHKIIAPGLEMA